MMKKSFVLAAALLVLLMPCAPLTISAAADPAQYYAKYLSVADVEQATGLAGITAKHQYTLHFMNAQGKEILQVRFEKASGWDNETRRKDSWTTLPGIGDKAAIAIPHMPYMIAFTKGPHMVVVGTFPQQGLTMFVTVDQLKAICKTIEARLPKTDYL